MTRPSSRKRFVVFLLFILLFLFLIPVTILYSTGYRLGKDLSLQPTGGIYVYYPESGVTVTVKGQAPQKTSIFAKSVLIQNLNPDTYEIDVSKPGYSYWKKNVKVLEKRVAEAYPFLVLEPLATSSVPISLKPIISGLFSATTTSTTTRNIFSLTSNGNNLGTSTFGASSTLNLSPGVLWKNVYLYKEPASVVEKNKKGEQLIALWTGETADIPFYFCDEVSRLCDSSSVVTISGSPIRHFDFYPGRNDVIIYSNDDGVFVTELDKREQQNFVTLVKGKVDFRLYNGHIYVKDKNSIYEVIYG